MTQARDIFRRASILLADAAGVRWTPVEMRDWLNDALREITVHTPAATAKIRVLDMVAGTRQTLPTDCVALLGVNANITGAGARLRSISMVEKHVLDQQMRDWQNPSVLTAQAIVQYAIDDPFDQRTFLVAPANDGTGKIEVLVSERPTEITVPADSLNIEAYTDDVDLDPVYINAALDYVLYRCFSKDVAVAGALQRAQMHWGNFATALGLRQQTEMTTNPDTPRGPNG